MEDPALWLGLYGALLSTILGVVELLKRRRQVSVECSLAIPYGRGFATGRFLQISAVNVGHRAVTLTSAGLVLSDGRKLYDLGSTPYAGRLPKMLEDGEHIQILMDIDGIRQELSGLGSGVHPVCVFVSDNRGKFYTSKKNPKQIASILAS
jgi:hypothetical protein